MPASEMEPSRAAFLQSQVEVVEEEEDYMGKHWLSGRVVVPKVPGKMPTRGATRPDPARGQGGLGGAVPAAGAGQQDGEIRRQRNAPSRRCCHKLVVQPSGE